MTVTQISPRTVEQTQPMHAVPRKRKRAMSSPPRTAATCMSIAVKVHSATEIEVIPVGTDVVTVVFRDQMTGTAVEITIPETEIARAVGVVNVVRLGQREASTS